MSSIGPKIPMAWSARRKDRRLSTRERTAYHEAGHAVVAELVGLMCVKTTIVRDKLAGSEGTAFIYPWLRLRKRKDGPIGREKRAKIRRHIMVLHAGGLVAAMVTGRWDLDGDESDSSASYALLRHLFGITDRLPTALEQDEMLNYDSRLLRRVFALVNKDSNWSAIEQLAESLLREKTIARYGAPREIVRGDQRSSQQERRAG